ncbi:MAG: peptide MFS transporter [Pseudobdellovibrionaceae bacterium]
MAEARTAVSEKTFYGHPRGLFTLFFTEMWERFSFYGMRVLLVLYMTQYLFQQAELGQEVWGYSTTKWLLESFNGPLSKQALSSLVYGLYTAFVYFTPFFGGLLSDRYLGQRRSVYIGGFLMAIGHFLMAVESLFFPALLFLILGNGFFKPNISTQVGGLYSDEDNRRDGAYTIFYMGINIGALLSPFICGTLGQKVGWHWGFGAAGVGMLLSLCIYHFGGKHLPETKRKHSVNEIHKEASKPMSQEDKIRTWALTFLCMITIFFWGVYEQQGNTLQLWSDQNTNWNFFGFEMPSTWYQAFNPFIIIFFAPVLDKFWQWRASRNKSSSSVAKMAFGCFVGSAALLIMYAAAKSVGANKGSTLWLLSSTFLLTMAELYISPIGLSLVTKVSPTKIVSMMMGVWFLASFFGNYIAGQIGSYYEVMSKQDFFLLLAGLSLIPAVLFLLTHKLLTKALGKNI